MRISVLWLMLWDLAGRILVLQVVACAKKYRAVSRLSFHHTASATA